MPEDPRPTAQPGEVCDVCNQEFLFGPHDHTVAQPRFGRAVPTAQPGIYLPCPWNHCIGECQCLKDTGEPTTVAPPPPHAPSMCLCHFDIAIDPQAARHTNPQCPKYGLPPHAPSGEPDRLEPFANARELNLAHANERGPWPALYALIDAYERQTAALAQRDQTIAELRAEQDRLRIEVHRIGEGRHLAQQQLGLANAAVEAARSSCRFGSVAALCSVGIGAGPRIA